MFRVRGFSLPLLFCIATLAACNTPFSEVEDAERRWAAQEVSNYRIEVLVVNSIWHAQSHTVTVQNGEVTDAAAYCIPAPFEGDSCEVEPFEPESFTIPGLFAKARAELQRAHTALNITFDPIYGFPDRISFDDPEILDEDWGWRVTSFEPLDD